MKKLFLFTVMTLAANLCLGSAFAETSTSETTRVLTRESVIEKYRTSEDQYVTLDGIEIHYRAEGSGPAVLLLHGTLGDLMDWDVWADSLKDRYRVIRFDLPGFGTSADMPNANYSVDRMHTTIDSLMDHLGEEQFALVGISYGGMVAFRYAATRVARVSSLILLNSAGIQTGKAPPKAKGDSKAQARKNFFTHPIVEYSDIEGFYDAYINDPKARSPEFIGRKLDFLNIVGREVSGHQARNLYEVGDPIRVLSHVQAPALVMWGEGNAALDTQTAHTFVTAMKNSCLVDLVTFEGGGHYINVGRPQESVEPAARFLDRLRAGNTFLTCPK